MQRLTGIPRERAVGNNLFGLSPALDAIGLAERLRRAIDGGPVPASTLTVRLPGGLDGDRAESWMEARCMPLYEGSRIAGATAFLRDVTSLRQGAVFVGAMAAIGRSLTTSLDLNEALDTIVAKAIDVTGAGSALVVSWDGQAPRVHVMRAAGRLSAEYSGDGTIPVAGGPLSRALREGHVVTTTNILADPRVQLEAGRRALIQREGFKAVAAAPLVSKGRVHGALVVHYWTERTFEEDEARTLGLMAEQAAIAIDNTRLYAEARRRADRLRELAEVERLVAASLDIDDVLRRIVDATARLLGAPVVHLWTAEPGERALSRRASAVDPALPQVTMPDRLPYGKGITGIAAEQRRTIFIADTARDPRVANPKWAEIGLDAMLSVPMVAGDVLLGVLSVRGRREKLEADEDHALAASLAARAAVALQNAGAYTHAVHRATLLRDLAAVSQSIAGSLDLDEVMQRIAQSAAALRPGALASVHTYDAERSTMRFAGHSGRETLELPDETEADGGLAGLVLSRRTPVLVERPEDHPKTLARDWWRARPGASYYGVPILAGEALVGVLDFVVPDGAPDAEQQEALSLLAAHAGLAIRNASLYEAERTQADRAEALAAIGQRLSGALDLDALLRTIAESAASLTGVRFASFWLADDERRTLTIGSGSDPEIMADFPAKAVSYDTGAVGWIARHRAPGVIDDVGTDDRVAHRDWWQRWGMRSFAAFPLMAGDTLMAVLALCDVQPLRFDPKTRELVEMFGGQAGVAIHNARLFRETQRRRETAEALARMGRELTSSLEVEHIATIVARGVGELIPALGAALIRCDDDGTLTVLAAHGEEADAVRGNRLVSGEGVVGRAVAQRRAVCTPDLLSDPDITLSPAMRERVAAYRYRAAAAVPLVAADRVIGAVAVGGEAGRIFTAEELQILQAVADQAALALENARLYVGARESLDRMRETQAQLVTAGKMTALGQLVSGVAHELNNPLSVIIGYGQLLLHRQIPEPFRRPVELMVQQGDRMAKIVRNLLFFARQRPPERTAVDLNQVIDQTLALRQHQLTLSGIAVERELGELPTVTGDGQQLQQVFLNMLLNAEQAIIGAKQGGRITFRSRTTDDGRRVRVEVIDDGPGIPPDVMPHIFEPFFSTKEVGTGTGLGLSVSYGIVEEHAGTLTVTSAPGATVFTVELPVGVPAAVIGVPRPAVLGSMSSRERRALVVEDEPEVADLVNTLLTEVGFRVDVAPGGHVALDQVRQRSYDLIVSDLRMADGSGEDFYRNAVMENPALRSRFVFMTGDLASADAFSFLSSATIPVIEKPFAPDQLLEAVRRVAGDRKESARV